MTKDEMLKERDRLGRAYQDAEGLRAPSRLVINAEFDYRAGFHAALELSERERVKPLRDALKFYGNDFFYQSGGHAGEGPSRLGPDVAKEALAQVEE